MLLTLLDLRMLVITSVFSSLIRFGHVVGWLVNWVTEEYLRLVVCWLWLEYCLLLVDKFALLVVVGCWFECFLLFHLVLRVGYCWGSYFLLELLRPLGGVPVEAGLFAVERAVVSVLGLVGHFVYYCLLFLLLEMVCTVSLYWFGLDYLLPLVVTVLGGCCRF